MKKRVNWTWKHALIWGIIGAVAGAVAVPGTETVKVVTKTVYTSNASNPLIQVGSHWECRDCGTTISRCYRSRGYRLSPLNPFERLR